MNFRTFASSLLLALAAAASFPVLAAWPEKPIKLVIAYPTGGLGANLGRLLADQLSPRLGQPVILDYRPGAGATIGHGFVKEAAPDGYTIILGTIAPLTMAPSLYKTLPYDSQKDFEPIAMTFIGGNIIVVKDSSPIRTFADLRAQAKAKPGALTYGSAGNGTTYHLLPAMFDQVNGSSMVHVPYKGGAPAYMGLLGGETSVVFGDTSALTLVNDGKLRVLATMNKKRLSSAPNVPTTAELGMPGLELDSWYGLLAPAGTPKAIIDRLNRETAAILASPAVREQLKTMYIEPAPDTSTRYFAEQIASELARWRPVIKAAGIQVD